MEHLTKKFYATEFKISFCLRENGSVLGDITKTFTNFGNIRRDFSGIFIQKKSQTSLIFFTEIAEILTCFTGEIFYYPPNEECLWLRYWPINKLLPESYDISDCKSMLLFNCPNKDQTIESGKVIDFLPNSIFA